MDYEYWTKTINEEDRKINNANRRFRYQFAVLWLWLDACI